MIKFIHYNLDIKKEEQYDEQGNPILDDNKQVITKDVKEEQSVLLDIVEIENKITVKFKFSGAEQYNQVDITKQVNKAFDVVVLRTYKDMDVRIVPVYDKLSFINYSTGIAIPNTTKKIVRVVFNQDDIVIVPYFKCDCINNAENILMKNHQTITGAIIEHSEWVKAIFPKIEKKGRFLADIDIYKSIAYLEAQVDLLTKIILKTSDIDNLKEVLQYADKNSVLNIKPLEDIKNEFIDGKSNIRNKQEEYYGEIIN